MKKLSIIIFILLSVGFLSLFARNHHVAAQSGGGWVSHDERSTGINRICQNGAEIMVLDTAGLNWNPANEIVDVELLPHAYMLNDESELKSFTQKQLLTTLPSGETVSTTYYSGVVTVEQMSKWKKLAAKQSLQFDLTDDVWVVGGTNYYQYTTGDQVTFSERVPINEWVALIYDSGRAFISQVSPCLINVFQTDGINPIILTDAFYGPANQLIELDALAIRLDQPPSFGTIYSGNTTLNQQSYVAFQNLIGEGVTYVGSGNETVKFNGQATFRVSEDFDGNQFPAGGVSNEPSITFDGSKILFTYVGSEVTTERSIEDNNGLSDIMLIESLVEYSDYLYRRINYVSAGRLMTGNGSSFGGKISNNGEYIVFSSNADNLLPTSDEPMSQALQTFVGSSNRLIRQIDFSNGITQSDILGSAILPVLGNERILFQTAQELPQEIFKPMFPASNLFGDANSAPDILSTTISDDTTYVISARTETTSDPFLPIEFTETFTGNGYSENGAVSGDDTTIAFESAASNLVQNDTNGQVDILLKRDGERLKIVSVNSNEELAIGGNSSYPQLSYAGNHIAFQSRATNLGGSNPAGISQIYVRDEAAGCTVPISININGEMGNFDSAYPSISANGRLIAFESGATNLVNGDKNGFNDIFLLDRDADNNGSFYAKIGSCTPGPYSIKTVSVSSYGEPSNGNSESAVISGDGEFVAFVSSASNLVTDDTNNAPDIFMHYSGFSLELHFTAPEPTPTPTSTETPTLTPEVPTAEVPTVEATVEQPTEFAPTQTPTDTPTPSPEEPTTEATVEQPTEVAPTQTSTPLPETPTLDPEGGTSEPLCSVQCLFLPFVRRD